MVFSQTTDGVCRHLPSHGLKITREIKSINTNPPAGEQVLRSEHAYMINSILSDNNARAPMFGTNSVLNLPFPAAAKTGTTNDFRDNWTLGYTPNLAVGVWVGNADYTPDGEYNRVNWRCSNLVTVYAAGYSNRFRWTITGLHRPPSIVDRVCSISGTEPSEWCPSQRSEIFAFDQGPEPKEKDLWQEVNIDTWTGLRASPHCSDFTEETFGLNVEDETARRWITDTDQGRAWAASIGFQMPGHLCTRPGMSRKRSASDHPVCQHYDGQTITSNDIDIYAVVYASEHFSHYRLEFGYGENPNEWHFVAGWHDSAVSNA
jgi:membrane peptidoglycan carboxypeptidase